MQTTFFSNVDKENNLKKRTIMCQKLYRSLKGSMTLLKFKVDIYL